MSFWERRRVLVTGCTGFLGFWLTQSLVARGAEVVGLVRDRVPWSPFFRSGLDRRVSVVDGDLGDLSLLQRALGEYEVQTVFHLAAQAIVGVANHDPLSTFESNIRGTWLLLEACRHARHVTGVVTTSSDKAYGVHRDLPYREDTHALQGRHPYDVSKSCADLISLAYAATYRLPVATVRCGNLFGPGDLNMSRIVPGTICAALRGERPVIRSDGSPVRDYLFVGDAVAGYLALGERLDAEAVRGRPFNFGTGERRSVLELTRMILAAAGRPDLEPEVQGAARNEIDAQYLAADAAASILGWRPGAPLASRLAETVAWYRDNLPRP
jgi:CDP-glucose 4,6-dehydratase